MTSKKRKAESDAESAPAEKKQDAKKLGADEILIKYKGSEFPANLSKLRAFCKHPVLAESGEGSIKAGEAWPIDEKLVEFEKKDLEEFLVAVHAPFSFRPTALTSVAIIRLALVAHYFHADEFSIGLANHLLGLETLTLSFVFDKVNGSGHHEYVPAGPFMLWAQRFVTAKRSSDCASFIFYCVCVAESALVFMDAPPKTPKVPWANAQFFYDVLRCVSLRSKDKLGGQWRWNVRVLDVVRNLQSV